MLKTTYVMIALLGFGQSVLAQEVNVYSARQPELIEPIFQAFTGETGINVNSVFMDKGMIERLTAEGEHSPADLILTTDIANLSAIVASGVTQPVKSALIEAAIPAEFRDPGQMWFGITLRARVIYASRERVAEGEVTTYEDLADPKWHGRLCTRSGLHNYNLALLSAEIAHHGAEGAQIWAAGLKANLARRPEGGDRDQAKAIWSGVCDIALGNTYYIGEMMQDDEQKQWAQAVRVDFPIFEDGGTHVNISGMAMTSSAPNHENALKLMEFLVSHKAQELYANLNFEYPLAAGVAVPPLVDSWGSLTSDNTSLADIAANRAQAVTIMENVDFDG